MIEISVGTLVFGTILSFAGFPAPYETGFLLNITEETLCFIVSYITERIWNKVDWGRQIEDIEAEQ